MTEPAIQAQIMRALKTHPLVAHFWRRDTMIHGYLVNGIALFIECKRPTAKATKPQLAFLRRANCAGAVAFVARSVADCWAVLDEINKEKSA